MHLECGFGVGDIGRDPSDVSQKLTLVPRNIWYIDTLPTITEIQPGKRVIPYPLLFSNLSLRSILWKGYRYAKWLVVQLGKHGN